MNPEEEPQKLNHDSTDWERGFQKLLNQKSKIINYTDYSKPNRRLEGAMGRESERSGFRAVILYFKLSTKVNLKIVPIICKILHKQMERPKYATLFLNDPRGNLLYPKSMVYTPIAVTDLVNQYYQEHAAACQEYSGVLKQIFPPYDMYVRDSYPDKNDLIVVIQDGDGILIDKSLQKFYRRFGNNFIWITSEIDSMVQITEKSRTATSIYGGNPNNYASGFWLADKNKSSEK